MHRITIEKYEDLRELIQRWSDYAEVTHECAPTASEVYQRCARQLEQALEDPTGEYPLPI